MGMVAVLFNSIAPLMKNFGKDRKIDHIFYKIVDFDVNSNEYIFQCINTHAVFRYNILEIVDDIDILYGLHPNQACFIGIEYANYFNNQKKLLKINKKCKYHEYDVPRYGKYSLQGQDRKGNILFIEIANNIEFLMNPCEIALSETLIQEFDAAQAFYIGFFTGINNSNRDKSKNIINNAETKKQSSFLKIIK
jgi:hypothetical protein